MNGTPRTVGSIHVQTVTQLAEGAINVIGSLRKHGLHKRVLAYEVGLDLAGRVVVDRLGMTPPNEWVMTCTYASDPDELADEIRAERDRRDGKPARRVVAGEAGLEKRRNDFVPAVVVKPPVKERKPISSECRDALREAWKSRRCKYLIEGMSFDHLADVHRALVARGFEGSERSIYRRLIRGINTWDELLKPVNARRSAGASKGHLTKCKAMREVIDAYDARKAAA